MSTATHRSITRNSQITAVRLPLADREALDRYAAATGATKTAIIVDAIRRQLATPEPRGTRGAS